MTQNYFVYFARTLFFLIAILPTAGISQNSSYHFDEKLKIKNVNPVFSTVNTSSPLNLDEDGDWKTEYSVPGIVGNIYTTASDADNLYIGGNFKSAGSIGANSIVRWDGSKWHSLGEDEENGVFSDSTQLALVHAIAIYRDYVFVGGQFSRAGTKEANGIAYWDGKNWNSLGTGEDNGTKYIVHSEKDTLIRPGSVYSLFISNDKLYVGGYFQLAGRNVASGVAIWDIKKRKWLPMEGGLISLADSSAAFGYGFAELNGQIIVGGKFDHAGDQPARNIAAWNGNSWQSIGDMPNHITGLKSDGKGHVYTVGYRKHNDSSEYCGIGMWDGKEWHEIPGPEGYYSTVEQIKIINGELFITGTFEHPDGIKACIARWNGKDWKMIQGPGYALNNLQDPVIKGIEFIKGRYYIAGNFTRVNDKYAVNVAEWIEHNNTWKTLDDGSGNKGIYDGTVYIIEKQGNSILAGGSFNIAGGKLARNIARWNGNEWESLGNGEDNGIIGLVFTILANEQNVFIGGYFGKAGTSEAFHIAQWDGKKWKSLGIGVGGIAGAHVRDLALVGDHLYVAGYFSKVGDELNPEIPANSIARFNLVTRRWDAPLKGLQSEDKVPGTVYDIEVIDNKIVIGGDFDMAGGYHAHNFTVIENFEFINPGMFADVDGIIHAVEIVNGQIIIGGHLYKESSADQAFGVLKWTEKGWEQICQDSKLSMNNGKVYVTDIEPFRDGFIAGGFFDNAGSKQLNNLAYFNGIEWTDVGGGIKRGVSDFVINDNRLFLTGPDVISSSSSNGMGLAEFDFTEITAVEDQKLQNPLLSNYPNPFKNSTAISYQVKYPAQVDLTVYDVSGKRIKTLVKEQRTEGQYTSTFHSQDLEPGIYLCRLSYGSESETLKFIVSE